MDEKQARLEKRAGWLYWWLAGSSLITVPWMIVNLVGLNFVSRPSGWSYFGAVALPALPHLLFLPWWFRSQNAFVRGHLRQALLLFSLRFGLAVLAIGLTQAQAVGIVVWLYTAGALWGVSFLGVFQVHNGKLWWKGKRAASLELPRPWATPAVKGRERHPTPTGQTERIEALLAHFRSGTSTQRRKAIDELENLGQVRRF